VASKCDVAVPAKRRCTADRPICNEPVTARRSR
jgi:hypothetical protein